MPKPINRRPNVIHIFAILTHFSFFVTRRIVVPTKTRNMMKYLIRNVENTNRSDVKLLPMFMPIIKPLACKRVNIPPLTRLMIITVVGVEDCVIPTVTTPKPTLAKRFSPVFLKNRCSISDGRPNIFDSITTANKNTPIPINNSKTEVVISQNKITFLQLK